MWKPVQPAMCMERGGAHFPSYHQAAVDQAPAPDSVGFVYPHEVRLPRDPGINERTSRACVVLGRVPLPPLVQAAARISFHDRMPAALSVGPWISDGVGTRHARPGFDLPSNLRLRLTLVFGGQATGERIWR